jgi:hypothetical protein
MVIGTLRKIRTNGKSADLAPNGLMQFPLICTLDPDPILTVIFIPYSLMYGITQKTLKIKKSQKTKGSLKKPKK